jgi:hypothetical protein
MDKDSLIQEIEMLPPHIIDEIYVYLGYLKFRLQMISDITIASEAALASDWLLPEEDLAWADL